MIVSKNLESLPFELTPDQYAALVEQFHTRAADFLKGPATSECDCDKRTNQLISE